MPTATELKLLRGTYGLIQVTVPVGLYPVTAAVHRTSAEDPTTTDAGAHNTLVLDAILVTAREKAQQEPPLQAVTLALPVEVAVYFTLHQPLDGVHVRWQNMPVLFVDQLNTAFVKAEEAGTSTVQRVLFPTTIDAGTQDIATVITFPDTHTLPVQTEMEYCPTGGAAPAPWPE
jgi:hypothetical protein